MRILGINEIFNFLEINIMLIKCSGYFLIINIMVYILIIFLWLERKFFRNVCM